LFVINCQITLIFEIEVTKASLIGALTGANGTAERIYEPITDSELPISLIESILNLKVRPVYELVKFTVCFLR
jgi:hypothetical protein